MMKRSFVFMLALAACGSPETPPKTLTPVATAGTIAISEPRLRMPPPGAAQTAAYFTLTNQGTTEDRLVSASSPDAGKLELHAHIKLTDGTTQMRQITAIDIPANATIPLSPGGLHVMVKDIKRLVKIGDHVPVRLVFASGATAQFGVPVVANPAQSSPTKDATKAGHQH
jgi:periplasmic copper chaperone A